MNKSHFRFGLAMMALLLTQCTGRSVPTTKRTAAHQLPRAVEESILEVNLMNGAPEQSQQSLLGAISQRTFPNITDELNTLRDSPPKGLFVRFGSRLGFARASELGRIFEEYKKLGKPIVCHADEYDNSTYLLAAKACTSIWLSPAGQVESVGIAAQLLFAKDLLNNLGVEVDFLQVGKFKGASEPFTRNESSPEARESLQATLKGIRTEWLDQITAGRSQVNRADMEDGPFAPEAAKSKGLVDEIGYVDDAKEDLKKKVTTDSVVRLLDEGEPDGSVGDAVLDILRGITGASQSLVPHIAVVSATGAISMSGGDGFGGSDGISESQLSRTVSRLTRDDSVKAVVLRIDSPGGSALASDLLWKKLMALRDEKPLVVSVGSMAASGGYYLACAANKIVAEPTSIVGSIGVVGGKFSFGTALNKVGVHPEIISASGEEAKGRRATYLSPLSSWDESTRNKVLDSMTSIYSLFLRRIAEGRGIAVEKLEGSAEGRIFSGKDAKDRGLVDEMGGLLDAIRVARDIAKLPTDTPVDIVIEQPRWLEKLADIESEESAKKSTSQRVVHEVTLSALGQDGHDAFAVIDPMIRGETSIVAMPYLCRF